MVHSKKRSRGCGEEKDGESSDQAKRRREMRLQGADDEEFLQRLRKKMKAVARRALGKRFVDNSGVSNLVQEQVESLVQEQVGRLFPNSELTNLVQEQVERLVQEHVGRFISSSRKEEQVEKLVQGQVERHVQEQVGRFVPNSEPTTNPMQAQVERLVQEQIWRIIPSSEPTNPPPEVAAGQSETRLPAINLSNSQGRYRLQFQNDIPEILYTWNKVKLKGNEDVEIAIFDTPLGSIATSSPWSSAKVQVVVLVGQEWRDNETFMEHIVKPREGKGPLLLGDVIQLKQGVGRLTDLTFTDNSAWTPNKKFRLGLRQLRDEGANVGQGMSKPFRVLERRGKGNEKHHPPEPTDEVHYLEKIGKNGPIHNRLKDGGISTVQQLLLTYETDREKLRRLIGGERGVAAATWDAIIEHAKQCWPRPGDELHSYDLTEQASLGNLTKLALLNPSYLPPFEPMLVGINSTSSFVRQQECPAGGSNSKAFPNQMQCCGNEVLCDELWTQDPSAQSSNPFSHLFTPCQEASTSMFRSDPSADEMNHPIEEDWAEMILEYRRHELVRHWAMAIMKLKFVIHIEKNSAIRRSKNVSF